MWFAGQPIIRIDLDFRETFASMTANRIRIEMFDVQCDGIVLLPPRSPVSRWGGLDCELRQHSDLTRE